MAERVSLSTSMIRINSHSQDHPPMSNKLAWLLEISKGLSIMNVGPLHSIYPYSSPDFTKAAAISLSIVFYLCIANKNTSSQ